MSLPVTLRDQITEARNMEISYDVLHPNAILRDNHSNRNILIPFSSLTNKYKDFLSTIIESVKLSDMQMRYYQYNPKKVSSDLYGTTELWNDILIINNCYSVFNFNPRILKFYSPSKLKELLNEILILEKVIE